jgi:hypothetical protein
MTRVTKIRVIHDGEVVRLAAGPGNRRKTDRRGNVLVSAHPELGGLWERKVKQPALGNATFIDQDACRKYAARARAWLAQTLADDAAAAQIPAKP